MTPLQYYLWIRKYEKYRPPQAALATLARFCEHDDYWKRAQAISDWLNKRNPDDAAVMVAEGTGYEFEYEECMDGESICGDCANLRWINPDEFIAECEEALRGKYWPGRANNNPDIIACPYFRPIGREPI